jgi:hypothetical protein
VHFLFFNSPLFFGFFLGFFFGFFLFVAFHDEMVHVSVSECTTPSTVGKTTRTRRNAEKHQTKTKTSQAPQTRHAEQRPLLSQHDKHNSHDKKKTEKKD